MKFLKAALFCLAAAFVFRFILPGVRFTALLFLLAAVVFAIFAVLEKKNLKKLKRVLCIALAAGFLFFCTLEFFVIKEALKGETTLQADAVIVLGAGVNGKTPSHTLQTRIHTAAQYLTLLDESVPVILSGGQGGGEEISEAECMRRELVRLGIDESRLVLEDKSTDTRENFSNSCAILREMGLSLDEDTRIAIVTSSFHLCRAKLLLGGYAEAEAVGIGAPLPWLYLSVNYYVREAFALAELLIFGG